MVAYRDGVFCLNLFNISHFYMDSPCNHGVWNWLVWTFACHKYSFTPQFPFDWAWASGGATWQRSGEKGGLMKQSVSNLLLFDLFPPNSLHSLSVYHSVSVCLVLHAWPLFSISLTFLLYVFNTTETLRYKGLPPSQLSTSLCLH